MSFKYAELTGDWPRFRYIIKNLTPKLKIAIRSAARRNAIFIIREIKKGIRNQSPGDIPFIALSGLTIKQKRSIRGIGAATSNKALVRRGDLLRLLSFEIDSNGSFKVGYKKGQTNSSGVNIEMIAGLMERGFTIRVTDSLRKYFASQGTPLSKSTTHLEVPARPFLQPVLDKNKDIILKNYIDAIDRVLRGNPDIGYSIDGGGDSNE